MKYLNKNTAMMRFQSKIVGLKNRRIGKPRIEAISLDIPQKVKKTQIGKSEIHVFISPLDYLPDLSKIGGNDIAGIRFIENRKNNPKVK